MNSGFSGNYEEAVGSSLHASYELDVPLHVEQFVEASVNGESGELPFDYMGEPHEGPDVIEIYGEEGLLRPLYLKSSILKDGSLSLKVVVRERDRNAVLLAREDVQDQECEVTKLEDRIEDARWSLSRLMEDIEDMDKTDIRKKLENIHWELGW